VKKCGLPAPRRPCDLRISVWTGPGHSVAVQLDCRRKRSACTKFRGNQIRQHVQYVLGPRINHLAPILMMGCAAHLRPTPGGGGLFAVPGNFLIITIGVAENFMALTKILGSNNDSLEFTARQYAAVGDSSGTELLM
jgi:hypothetical protein